MKATTLALAAAAGLMFSIEAAAAHWQTMASERGERVEIDLSRIARMASGKTVAWSRLVLGRSVRDPDQGDYNIVEALNQYDCGRKRFATVKRRYLMGEVLVREELVAAPREMDAASGGADDRLLTEACRLRTVGEMERVAKAAAQALTKTRQPAPEEDAKVMHADMLTAAEAPKARSLTVADGAPLDKAVAPPDVLPPKRYIDLPKIDKPKVEHPKEATETATQKAAAAAARNALERQYATSGPQRRVTRRHPSGGQEFAAALAAERAPIAWSYDGAGGPANWGRLRPDYVTCSAGQRQSPIDVRDGIRVDLEPIAFAYRESHFAIVDTGHTVRVKLGEGNTIGVMGRQYTLTDIQFHRPAEERINGRSYDMDVQLVHRDAAGRIAVVAVMLEQGPEHPLIQTFWNNLPLETNQELAPAPVIDLNRLLPENRAYMTYMGSLTTPPCSEGVLWMVMKQPIQVSAEQMAIFARLYPNNARPLQAANNRLIKESR